MFSLVEIESGQLVRQKNGEPFVYTSKSLAVLGKRALEENRKVKLKIVSA